MEESEHGPMAEHTRALMKKLDAIGQALFFVWLGIAFLADVGQGIGILGVGVLALGGQVIRTYLGLAIEGFGLIMGLVFAVWGMCEVLNIRLSETPLSNQLLPILSILVGNVIIVSALQHRSREQPR